MDSRAAMGETIAALLYRAWRGLPAPTAVTEPELAAVARLLVEKGSGALAWSRLRGTALGDTEAAQALSHAYWLHSAQVALREQQLTRVSVALANAAVRALLIKGWALSRLYPDAAMRPYGDIDLIIAPDQYEAAERALRADTDTRAANIDLHRGSATLFPDLSFGELYERAEIAMLHRHPLRIVAAEEHLRLLCLHLLKHGGGRPLWLCDIALFLENVVGQAFDWQRMLGTDTKNARRVLAVLALAERLLGAEARHFCNASLVPVRDGTLAWMAAALVREWGTVRSGVPRSARSYLSWEVSPREALRGLVERWPNPLISAIELDLDVDSPGELRHQLLLYGWKWVRFGWRMFKVRRARHV